MVQTLALHKFEVILALFTSRLRMVFWRVESSSLWGHLAFSVFLLSKLSNIQTFLNFFDFFELLWSFLNFLYFFWTFWIFFSFFELFWILLNFLNYFELFQPFLNFLELFKTFLTFFCLLIYFRPKNTLVAPGSCKTCFTCLSMVDEVCVSRTTLLQSIYSFHSKETGIPGPAIL